MNNISGTHNKIRHPLYYQLNRTYANEFKNRNYSCSSNGPVLQYYNYYNTATDKFIQCKTLKSKIRYNYAKLDGIASIMLSKFAGSGDRIMLTVSKPEPLSSLRNSFSLLILPL